MKIMRIATVCLCATATAGCGQAFNLDDDTMKTAVVLVGAGVGGLVGAQFGAGTGQLAATGAGVLLGAFAGKVIGDSLSEGDKQPAEHAAYEGLERGSDGRSRTWQNPDSGHSGSFTPVRTYELEDGTPCREFEQSVSAGGVTDQSSGTACREPDGDWAVDNT